MSDIVVTAPRRHRLGDPAAFFAKAHELTGPLNAAQVQTINALLDAASHWPIAWLAYGLATAWHEARLQPIEEWGKGHGHPYGLPGKYGQAPYGRGLCQITHDYNYEWADKACGLNGALLKDFSLALEPAIATQILVKGMETGAFTGKKLADYLPDGEAKQAAFLPARKIINGMDRADKVAGYAMIFQRALHAGEWA